MTFYFERSTGKRVSESTWKRSKAQGGSRFVRRSATPSPREGTRKKRTRPISADTSEPSTQGLPPSQSPRTYQEYQEQSQKKFKKKAYPGYFDYDDGREYETGVDY